MGRKAEKRSFLKTLKKIAATTAERWETPHKKVLSNERQKTAEFTQNLKKLFTKAAATTAERWGTPLKKNESSFKRTELSKGKTTGGFTGGRKKTSRGIYRGVPKNVSPGGYTGETRFARGIYRGNRIENDTQIGARYREELNR